MSLLSKAFQFYLKNLMDLAISMEERKAKKHYKKNLKHKKLETQKNLKHKKNLKHNTNFTH